MLSSLTAALHKILNEYQLVIYTLQVAFALERRSPILNTTLFLTVTAMILESFSICAGERGGSVVEGRTPKREVRRSKLNSAMLCP